MKKSNEIDLVYVLGTGSCWKDNELRFSLRSVEKNLRNYRRIYIIGHKPEFIKNVIHIPCDDIFKPTVNPDGNIIHKVLRACQVRGLSNNFLFMNDDYLILKPVDATQIPAYHKGNMNTFSQKYFENGFWRTRLHKTFKILQKKNLSTWHYDGHIPIIINKKKFPEIMSMFDYEKNYGYCMKSLYANVAYKSGIHIGSVKKVIFRPYILEMYDQKFSNCVFAAVNDNGIIPYFKRWIFGKFPEPSQYEKIFDNAVLAALAWFNSEKDIKKGIVIYQQYGKSGNVKKYFKNHKPSVTFRKLEYHLHKII